MNRRSFLSRLLAAVAAPFVARAAKPAPPADTWTVAYVGRLPASSAPDEPIELLVQGLPMTEGLDEAVPCMHVFRSKWCGYSGPERACDKRFTTCRRFGNEKAFGGMPGLHREPRLRHDMGFRRVR